MKKWNFFSRDERHESPFKFNYRFILVKFAIEMCTHIGSTIMYLVCENIYIFFQQIVLPSTNLFLFFACDLFYDTYLTCCQREVLNKFSKHL